MNDESGSGSQKSQIKRVNGKFAPGTSGNPGGGPKGRKTALVEIENAIEAYEKEHGVPYWTAATTLAMTLAQRGKTGLLEAIMSKFLPSKFDVEASAKPYVMMPSLRLKDGSELKFDVGSDPQPELPIIQQVEVENEP